MNHLRPALSKPNIFIARSSFITQTRHPTIRHASTLPLTIKPSREELAAGKLQPRNLERALRSLHEDGLVVVADVVPHEDLDRLNDQMTRDARTLQARGKDGPFNYNVGNLVSRISSLDRRTLTPAQLNSNKTHRLSRHTSTPPSS